MELDYKMTMQEAKEETRQFKKISVMTPTEYITSIKALSERERQ